MNLLIADHPAGLHRANLVELMETFKALNQNFSLRLSFKHISIAEIIGLVSWNF